MIDLALYRAGPIQLIMAADAASMRVDPSCLPNALTNQGQSRRAKGGMQMPEPVGERAMVNSSWG